MDIEQFYDADERRRTSHEFEYGRDWHDAAGVRYEISWVADTGEIYSMREPAEPFIQLDPAGDEWVQPMPTSIITVEILGSITDRDALDRALAGWENAMGRPDSLSWVRERLAQAGAASL